MPSYLSPQTTQTSGGNGGFYLFMLIMCGFFIVMPYFSGSKQQQVQTPAATTETETVESKPQIKVAYPIEERTIETPEYKLVLTNVGGGRASQFYIKTPDRYATHGETGDFIRSQKPADSSMGGYLPFEVTLPYFQVGKETQFQITNDANDTAKVNMRYASPDGSLVVEKSFAKTDIPYVIRQEIKLTNNTAQPISDELTTTLYIKQLEEEAPSLFKAGSFVAAKCFADDDMECLDYKDKNENESYKTSVKWTAVDESYFAIALYSDKAASCSIENEVFKEMNKTSGKEEEDRLLKSSMKVPVLLQPGSSETYSYNIFMGPKESQYLEPFGNNLEDIIDYGWIEVLAKPMAWILATFKGWLGNWGLAIILLTFIVRLFLWPLAHKSQMSMLGMSKIAPLMQELQSKYKDDQQKLAEETMKLYKEYNINPASGCLPLLIQMPVFFALYRCIFVTGGLYHAPFYGWIHDLSAPDPYFILPIFSVVLLVSQQLLTPTQTKNTQQRVMMIMMPVIFGIMMLFLPSGLCLYMIVSSGIGMIQSFYCRKLAAKMDIAPVGDAKPATIDVEAK